MKSALAIVLAGMCFLMLQAQAQEVKGTKAPSQRVRFEAVDVYADAGDAPLAAYQFEMAAEVGEVKIVGVEGGEHPAFADAPYYDPAALAHHRIIIAAFNTGEDLPAGRTRVARVHFQVLGDAEPEYVVQLDTAASADGGPLTIELTLERGAEK